MASSSTTRILLSSVARSVLTDCAPNTCRQSLMSRSSIGWIGPPSWSDTSVDVPEPTRLAELELARAQSS